MSYEVEAESTDDAPVLEEVRPLDIQDASSGLETPITARDIELPLSPPADADAFGTFESAYLATADAVSPAAFQSSEVAADAWGSPWAAGSSQDEGAYEKVDEWEAAKMEREMRDRRVVRQCGCAIRYISQSQLWT